jgi:hypothetical protein
VHAARRPSLERGWESKSTTRTFDEPVLPRLSGARSRARAAASEEKRRKTSRRRPLLFRGESGSEASFRTEKNRQ